MNNRDKNYTVAKAGKRMERVDGSASAATCPRDRADCEENDVTEARTTPMKEKIARLTARCSP